MLRPPALHTCNLLCLDRSKLGQNRLERALIFLDLGGKFFGALIAGIEPQLQQSCLHIVTGQRLLQRRRHAVDGFCRNALARHETEPAHMRDIDTLFV